MRTLRRSWTILGRFIAGYVFGASQVTSLAIEGLRAGVLNYRAPREHVKERAPQGTP